MMTDAAVHELALRLEERLCSTSGFARHMLSTPRLVAHLRARFIERGLRDVDALEELFIRNHAEYAALEQLFSPAETWLFRYPESFALLRDRCAMWRGDARLRVVALGSGGWSEPISIAATLMEAQDRLCESSCGARNAQALEVLAVDRNAALFAREPMCESLHLRGGIPAWAARHVQRTSHAGVERAQPSRAVQDMLRTEASDIASWLARQAQSAARYHAVFFRNVAIYMEDARRLQVLRLIADLIVENGLLFVGHAETELAMRATGFDVVDASGVFALQRKAVVAPPQNECASQPARAGREPVPPIAQSRRDGVSVSDEAVPDRQTLSSDPAEHVRQAVEHELRGEFDLAAQAVTRAIYLDHRCEDALILAARLAERRGASREAQRFRMRALQAHLDRQIVEGDESNQEKG